MNQQLSSCRRQDAAASWSHRPVPLPTDRTLEKVEAVGDLCCLGRCLAHRLGERTTPVPSNDLDVLGPMVFEPGRHGGGFAVGQHVHHTMLLEIDHNGSVAHPAAEREIVNAQDPQG